MFNKESIRFKFFQVICVILVLSTFALSAIVALNERRMLENALKTKGQGLASYIAKLGKDPLIMNDGIQLDAIVHEAIRDGEIVYAFIQDSQGNLVTSQYASIDYLSPRLKGILHGLPKDSELKDIIAAIKDNSEILELSVPIRTDTAIAYGKVTIGMSLHKINHQMIRTILSVLALNVAAAFVLGAVLFGASKKIILDPISALSDAAANLAKGDLSTRVVTKSTGEMQVLLDSFNTMIGNLEKTTVSKDYVDNIIKSMSETLIIISPENTIKDVNAAAGSLLGYTREELIGEPISTVIDASLFVDHFVAGKEILAYREAVLTRKDGRKIPVFFSASQMVNADNVLQGIVCAAHDMTYIKRVTGELEAKNQELEKAYMELNSIQMQILQQEKMASIGQLAAGVAHEINNPIGFVSSNLTTLNKYAVKLLDFITLQGQILARVASAEDIQPVSEKRQEIKLDYITRDITNLISESLDGTDRVRRIVQDLKSFSRLDEAEEKMADINAGLESTINMVWNELKYKATLQKSLGDIPPIKCHPGQLNQVFMNLLVNAAHAIEKQGEITVQTREENGSIIVSISDTGCGIPEATRKRIFEPFYTTKEVGKGTGLGLSIAYDIIKKHRGEITVDSTVGKGTTFCVILPSTR